MWLECNEQGAKWSSASEVGWGETMQELVDPKFSAQWDGIGRALREGGAQSGLWFKKTSGKRESSEDLRVARETRLAEHTQVHGHA